MKPPTTTRRRFLGTMGTLLVATAVRAKPAQSPAAAADKTGEMVVFDHEFTWTDDRPFFSWSLFAPGLNRPGLLSVETDTGEETFEPFDAGQPSYPENWMEPNDYWNGNWQFRYQFKNRPGDRPGTIHAGIWSDRVGYWKSWKEMMAPQVPFHGKSGTFFGKDGESPANSWWRKEKDRPVDFSRVRDFTRLGFVMWTDHEKVLHPARQLGEQSGWWSDGREDYYPCTIKATIVAVPAGKTFSGWERHPI